MGHATEGSIPLGSGRDRCLLLIACLLIGLAQGWGAQPDSQKASAAPATKSVGPTPQVLAGVHSRLGQPKQAQEIL